MARCRPEYKEEELTESYESDVDEQANRSMDQCICENHLPTSQKLNRKIITFGCFHEQREAGIMITERQDDRQLGVDQSIPALDYFVYICSECNNRFTFPTLFMSHLKTVHRIQSYRCLSCQRVFLDPLTPSLLDFPKIKVEELGQSGNQSVRENNLQLTSRMLYKEVKTSACFRFYQFETRSSTAEGEYGRTKMNDQLGFNEFRYNCPKCSSRFSSPSDFMNHLETIHNFRSYRNQLCDCPQLSLPQLLELAEED